MVSDKRFVVATELLLRLSAVHRCLPTRVFRLMWPTFFVLLVHGKRPRKCVIVHSGTYSLTLRYDCLTLLYIALVQEVLYAVHGHDILRDVTKKKMKAPWWKELP